MQNTVEKDKNALIYRVKLVQILTEINRLKNILTG